eukprot:g4308.t1
MASLGRVGNKVLRVALCLVEVEGVPAVPIDDVKKLVADHYDKVRYSNYSKDMMAAELVAMKAEGKCVAFLPMKRKSGAAFITGGAKAQGGYEAEVVGTGGAVRALHPEHAICRAINNEEKAEEMRFTAAGSTGIALLQPGDKRMVAIVPNAGNNKRKVAGAFLRHGPNGNPLDSLSQDLADGALLGDTHKDTFKSAFLLSQLLHAQGLVRGDKHCYGKEPVFRELQDAWRALVEAQRARQRGGAAREGMLQTLENLVYLLGISDEAELLARELLAGRSALLGEGHRDTRKAAGLLGWILVQRGKGVEAEQPLRQAAEGYSTLSADADAQWYAAKASLQLALLLSHQGRLDEAEPLARQALAELSKDNPNPSWNKMLAAGCLGRLHCKRAARYRAQGGDNTTTEEENELRFAAIMYRRALGGADT